MIKETKTYQAFYTKSQPIVDYMVNNLSLNPNDKIFEPCGGDGVFVEAILESNLLAEIDVYELNKTSHDVLQKKFTKFPNVKIKHCDTLLDTDLGFNSNFGGVYDKIIANPPYGAWQDYKKRNDLKKTYPNIYVKESYALFLYRCVKLLKEDGILSFIVPDTFLNIHTHKALRRHILTNTKILELALFPSSFFPGINFGYANLSILTLKKSSNKRENLNNCFRVINGFKNVEQLLNTRDGQLKMQQLRQEEIYTNPDYAFLIANDSKITTLIKEAKLRIGDIANCVTGFYSGDDKRFLRTNENSKTQKGYNLISQNQIRCDYKKIPDILNGIKDENYFLPIVKGGNTKYLKPDCWFMNWSEKAVSHYKTDKKSRFQNSQFYFKFGIGVPMISSSSITASLIENKLFDQSIVGIFPKDENFTYYLLAFFNSPTCNALIRTINPSANNPANYIKKIPLIVPNNEVFTKITEQTKQLLKSIKSGEAINETIEAEIHNDIKVAYGF